MDLVTGATGYVGGRLVPRLLEAGRSVRVLARDPARLVGRAWAGDVEIVRGDVLDPATLPPALSGVEVAYYLVHSMGVHGAFADRDRDAARAFAAAARDAGVKRIVYLGGLGDSASGLSDHLRSRQETGDALRSAGVPVTEFRAAVIVGSGSISFEMIRWLVERLPVMICPRWVYQRIQPVAVGDVLSYLVAAPTVPESAGKVVEIGGADVLTYRDMMLRYAERRGLRRHLVPVPFLTPRLSSHWVRWMTPVPASIARPLVEGLRNEVVVRDDSARRLFPDIHPLSYAQALDRAFERLERGDVETAWSDALASSPRGVPAVQLSTVEGMIIERRSLQVDLPPEALFRSFTGLGGQRGWLAMDWAWEIRGVLDQLAGGPGFRRGRRDPDHLRPGDALDFWRVEAVEPGRLLRLRAEMKVPGRAWLQFEAEPADGGSVLRQTAFFAPHGLAGHLYWYLLYPVHALIFSGLVRRVAERGASLPTLPPVGSAP
ncbi:MAG: SDR family oxidoreductase [Deltaproteobacteria bacterium]